MLDTAFVLKVAKWVIIVITVMYSMMGIAYAQDRVVVTTEGSIVTCTTSELETYISSTHTTDTLYVRRSHTHELVAIITDGERVHITVASGIELDILVHSTERVSTKITITHTHTHTHTHI